MCIIPDSKTDRRPGRGYKVVAKKGKDYYAWYSAKYKDPYAFKYKKRGWQRDPNAGGPLPGWRLRYPAGFHVGLSSQYALSIAKSCSPKERGSKLVVIEVSFRKVVASEMNSYPYGDVKVAEEIRFRREIPVEYC